MIRSNGQVATASMQCNAMSYHAMIIVLPTCHLLLLLLLCRL
jgi:hypothetical protein